MSRPLRELAHARAGDKGDVSNVCVIAYDARDFPLLCRVLTPERLKRHFGSLITGDVVRYELPQLWALNFVLRGALAGGVTRSTRLDPHGKALSSWMLAFEVQE